MDASGEENASKGGNESVLPSEGDKPKVTAALSGPNKEQWWDAMYREHNSLMCRGTWSEVQPTAGMNLLPCHWVLNVKRNAMGNVERFKARLVVGGDCQREGVDFEEIFAPTSRYSTLRTLLAIVAERDMEMHGLDVETAFLNGDLDEEVYMHPPKYFPTVSSGTVLRLNKALYGLKQAPRAWRKKLLTVLLNLGYVESDGDPGLFYRDENGSRQFFAYFC